ncbi:uncharacterized protein EV422DRAFT_321578 [Fimicolochytrium jonesii]|uniref:uncharacterized protein n=1 Tax=Fimicolochytrium jonesii TaxID=1396493 RepID=UPI0022FE1D10|nr:uncharacterized protein EV422DRAFT_321578 [Fimicolochytrium jonesii]KAI8824467.1 hypothetical protein EV422DRAFT_321578 [Fimicolochytrium jonesii]
MSVDEDQGQILEDELQAIPFAKVSATVIKRRPEEQEPWHVPSPFANRLPGAFRNPGVFHPYYREFAGSPGRSSVVNHVPHDTRSIHSEIVSVASPPVPGRSSAALNSKFDRMQQQLEDLADELVSPRRPKPKSRNARDGKPTSTPVSDFADEQRLKYQRGTSLGKKFTTLLQSRKDGGREADAAAEHKHQLRKEDNFFGRQKASTVATQSRAREISEEPMRSGFSDTASIRSGADFFAPNHEQGFQLYARGTPTWMSRVQEVASPTWDSWPTIEEQDLFSWPDRPFASLSPQAPRRPETPASSHRLQPGAQPFPATNFFARQLQALGSDLHLPFAPTPNQLPVDPRLTFNNHAVQDDYAAHDDQYAENYLGTSHIVPDSTSPIAEDANDDDLTEVDQSDGQAKYVPATITNGDLAAMMRSKQLTTRQCKRDDELSLPMQSNTMLSVTEHRRPFNDVMQAPNEEEMSVALPRGAPLPHAASPDSFDMDSDLPLDELNHLDQIISAAALPEDAQSLPVDRAFSQTTIDPYDIENDSLLVFEEDLLHSSFSHNGILFTDVAETASPPSLVAKVGPSEANRQQTSNLTPENTPLAKQKRAWHTTMEALSPYPTTVERHKGSNRFGE